MGSTQDQVARIKALLPAEVFRLNDIAKRVVAVTTLCTQWHYVRQFVAKPKPGFSFSHGDVSMLTLTPWPRTVFVDNIREHHRQAINAIAGVTDFYRERIGETVSHGPASFDSIGEALAELRIQKYRGQLMIGRPDGMPQPGRTVHAIQRSRSLNFPIPELHLAENEEVTEDVATLAAALMDPHFDDCRPDLNFSWVQDVDGVRVVVASKARYNGRFWEIREEKVVTLIPRGELLYLGSQRTKDLEDDGRSVDLLNTWTGLPRANIHYHLRERNGDYTEFVDVNDRDNVFKLGGISLERMESLYATTIGRAFIERTNEEYLVIMADLCDMSVEGFKRTLYDNIFGVFHGDSWLAPKPDYDAFAPLLACFSVSMWYAICQSGHIIPCTWISRRAAQLSLFPLNTRTYMVFTPVHCNCALVFKHQQDVKRRMLAFMGRSLDPPMSADAVERALKFQGFVPCDPFYYHEMRWLTKSTDDLAEAREVALENVRLSGDKDAFAMIKTTHTLIVVFRDSMCQSLLRTSNLIRDRDLHAVDHALDSAVLAYHGYGKHLRENPELLFD